MKKKTTHKVVQPVMSGAVPTIIEFLLDETGSMNTYVSQVIGGFQDFINEQRSIPGSCLFTLTKFDTRGQRNPYTDLDVGMVPYLTTSTYTPNGGTNLYDTIISRIEARYEQLKSWDIKPRVLFVCMTDGEDNASRYQVPYVKQRIIEATEDRWTFVFLGAYGRAEHVARNLGFTDGNIRCFEGARMQETMQELSAATKAYRVAETEQTTLYR